MVCFSSDCEQTEPFTKSQALTLHSSSQLGQSRVKKVWLTLRRIIAMAELTGLPRAAMFGKSHLCSPSNVTSHVKGPNSTQRQKADMWESICAIDRISSMMWSLPLATANFSLPIRVIYKDDGRIDLQSFLYRLVNIASHMLELDGPQATERSTSDLMAAVMSIDSELRSLESLAPKDWWQIQWSELCPDALLQYWHRYITIRTHLQLALVYNHEEKLALHFITCFNACQKLAERYVCLRHVSPDGFFANPVLDLQAFTSAVFLLLAAQRPHPRSTNVDSSALILEVVRALEHAADESGQDPVHQAAETIKSLSTLLEQSSTSEHRKISLYVPMFGKVHVCRKSRTNADPQADQLAFSQTNQTGRRRQSVSRLTLQTSDIAVPLDLSMEFLEDYSYLADQTLEVEDWLTWET